MFIEQWLEFSKPYETPTSFWKWSAYAILAALAKDRIFIQQGNRKTFANMYIFLLAQSANFRKSGPFSFAEHLLTSKSVPTTKVWRGGASIQGVLDDLGRDYYSKPQQKTLTGGCGIVLADEATAFFVPDDQLIRTITDIYDPRAEYRKSLKTDKAVIKGLCFNWLAASNEALAEDWFKNPSVINGGLLSRICIVKPDEIRPANDLLDAPETPYTEMEDYLAELNLMAGPMKFTSEALQTYRDWYQSHYDSMKGKEDITGISGRLHTHILKIAMVLSLSKLSMIISVEDIQKAIKEMSDLLPNYSALTLTGGSKLQAKDVGTKLLTVLRLGKPVTQQAFLLSNLDVMKTDLDQVVATFETAQLIKIEHGINVITYSLTSKGKERLNVK